MPSDAKQPMETCSTSEPKIGIFLAKALSMMVGNELTTVELPEGITSIANQAFKDNKLESIIIPTTINDIGISAFENNNLSEVIIPKNITFIGNKAFSGNTDIKLVFIALTEAISNAEEIDTAGKSEEAINVLNEAIEAAKLINEKPVATLEEVSIAISNINSAIEAILAEGKTDFEFSEEVVVEHVVKKQVA